MFPLIAALLTAMPGQASLLSLAGDDLRPSVRLLTQATAPRQAEVGPQPGSESSPPPTDLMPEARIRELTLKVEDLNDRLRALKTDWPIGLVAMTYSGYVLSPLLLVGLPLLIVGLVESGDNVTVAGATLTGVGAVGVGLLVAGLVKGTSSVPDRRAEKAALIRERTRLEDELRALKRRRESAFHRWGPARPARTVVVAAFSF